jgi:hypothetical protein
MAACGMCSQSGRKLLKRWYNSYKVYVCMQCALNNENTLTDKDLVNGHS